ncbi:MAG: hypothetical protein Q4E14_01455 [Lactobacillaceae bacterium]|nr:hypothetical protein [Lactobacillaceae bacterium]
MADNYDFMPKVVALDDAQHIIDIINETAQKYGQYYQQHDAWNHEADNLTHRPGNPLEHRACKRVKHLVER